ncbi:MAG: hypothetical protein AAGE52_38300 [Myxococcota bacterium]
MLRFDCHVSCRFGECLSEVATVLQVIDLVYASALGEATWQAALEGVSTLFGGRGSTLEVHGRSALSFFEAVDIPIEHAAEYQAYFHSVCPRIGPTFRVAAGEVSHDQLLAPAEVHDSEFYYDFLREERLKYFIAGTLYNDGRRFGVVTVQLPEAHGLATAAEIGWMKSLIPHLRRAMKLRDLLLSNHLEPFDALGLNVLFFDHEGRILSLSAGADGLLRSLRGLTLRGRLVAEDSVEDAALHRLVGDTATGETRGGSLRLTHSCGRPIVAHVCPMKPSETAPWANLNPKPGAVGVVLLLDPEARGAPTNVLEKLYGFTPAEARVANALTRGVSLAEYAERHGVEISTVRTHVMRIRSKTATASINQLTSLLLREVWQ